MNGAEPGVTPAPGDGAAPHQVMRQFQRDRMLVYVVAFLSAFALKAYHGYPVPYRGIWLLMLPVFGSGLAFDRFFARSRHRGAVRTAIATWILLDIAITSTGVVMLDGARGHWYFWYLSIFASAAFILEKRGIALVALGDTAGYLIALRVTGELANPGIPALALERMFFLHVSAWFFLRGVIALRESRRTVRRLNEALAGKTRELEAAGARLHDASEQKSRFLAAMSHELRTPLNAIIGFSEILETRLKGQIPDRLHGFVGNIRASGRHLHGLIGELLDLSKIEAGRMDLHFEPIVMKPLIEEILGMMRALADSRSIALTSEAGELPRIEADPVRVRQILYNLISNAVKYSPDGSRVTVRAAPSGEGGIVIEVIDQGIGIPSAEQEKVFEEFSQASTRSSATEGTGLGLPLARRLAELHRGTLTLTSEVGQGSNFRLTLPASPKSPAQ